MPKSGGQAVAVLWVCYMNHKVPGDRDFVV